MKFILIARKYEKTCSTSQVIRGTPIKTTVVSHFLLRWLGGWDNSEVLQRRKWHSHGWLCELVQLSGESFDWVYEVKKKMHFLWLAILCLDVFSTELLICAHKDGCSGKFISSLLVRGKRRENWIQPIMFHHCRMVIEFMLLIYLMRQYM